MSSLNPQATPPTSLSQEIQSIMGLYGNAATTGATSGIDPTLLALLGVGTGATTNPLLGATQQYGAQGIFPFPSNYFPDITETFHQTPGEYGNDYAMPVGTAIRAPFSGYITTESTGKQGWGNRIFVRDPATGMTFAVGHLNKFALTTGFVSAGTLIGYSGGAKDDPNSGNTTGPHIEAQLIDPSGQYIDPHSWLQQLLQTGEAGLPAGSWTPDGHFLVEGTQDQTFYNLASLAWEKTYGTLPPWSAIAAMKAAGVSNLDQVQAVLWGMPSAIPNVTMGAYETTRDAANKVAQKLWGRPVPDSYIQELFAQGITTAADIQLAIESSPAASIPKEHFQAVFDLANSYTQGIWNTPPAPAQVASIVNQIGAPALGKVGTPDPTTGTVRKQGGTAL